jgi:tetratricopeptide (TPR) repeat protein/predicted Ser/Thr protein kinase
MTGSDLTARTEPATAAADAAAGAKIGRFSVLEMLGRGGMGVVFGAYDPNLDRKVAVKFLHSAVGDDDGARLVREGRAMAKLVHPNVLTVHEVGTVEGQTFIAMEFAPGGTLRAWLRERRTWREVLERFREAGRGLAAAHASGMVHRDFKPENVLLGADGAARVADFGLVGTDSEAGGIAGTLAYMAPEQREGRAIGPSADQYAFCVSLREALTAERNPPGWLRDVVERGVRDDPAERWPSMEALLEALSRDPDAVRRRRLRTGGVATAALLLGGVATFALTRSAPRDDRCRAMDRHLHGVWDPARRSAVQAAFAGAPAIFERTADALDRHTGDWLLARTEVCEATHVRGEQSEALLDLRMACLDRRLVETDALIDLFAAPPSPDIVPRAIDAVAGLPGFDLCDDEAALRAVIPPPADPTARAEVDALFRKVADADALEDTGQFRDGLARALDNAAAAERTGHAPLLAEALASLAILEERNGDPKAAQTTAERGLLAAADAHDDYLAARLCSDLVFFIGDRQARAQDALALRPRCEAYLRRAGRPPGLEARLYNSFGLMYTHLGDMKSAHEVVEHALELNERVFGPDAHETATAINSLANLYDLEGNYQEARRLLERSLAIREHELGPEHPDVAVSLGNLANTVMATGDIAEAVRLHDREIAILEKTHGPNHPDVALAHTNLGAALANGGDIEGARRHHAIAVDAMEKSTIPDPLVKCLAMGNLGDALRLLGDLTGARQHLERALPLLEEQFGTEHAYVLWALRPLAFVELAEKNYEVARRLFERAIHILEVAYDADHPELSYVLAGLAETLLALHEEDAAISAGERAVKLAEAGGIAPTELASIRFSLALTLAHRDPQRALQLARAARDVLAAAGAAGAHELPRVEQWLRDHDRAMR